MAIPKAIAKPISIRSELPASVREANEPARITPAAPIVGALCLIAVASAARGSFPALASSRSRDIIRML